MPDQPIFDWERARQARDDAVQQVDENAKIRWQQAADEAVRTVATKLRFLTSDDVRYAIPEDIRDIQHEPRALGPVLLRAARDGILERTDRYEKTAHVRSHLRPKALWRSLIYRGGE